MLATGGRAGGLACIGAVSHGNDSSKANLIPSLPILFTHSQYTRPFCDTIMSNGTSWQHEISTRHSQRNNRLRLRYQPILSSKILVCVHPPLYEVGAEPGIGGSLSHTCASDQTRHSTSANQVANAGVYSFRAQVDLVFSLEVRSDDDGPLNDRHV
jgi:hypothetical protein